MTKCYTKMKKKHTYVMNFPSIYVMFLGGGGAKLQRKHLIMS